MAKSKTPRHAKPAKKAAVTPARTAKPAKPVAQAPARSAGKPAPKPSPVRPPARSPAAPKKGESVQPHPVPTTARFNDKDLAVFQKELLALRDRLTGQVARMRQDSLKRDDEVNPEEDGTDAFDRLFALERAGSDQDIIFTIDEAIRAIGEGKYGVCDACGKLIEKPRLRALPFAKNCIQCQSEMERGHRNGRPRRLVP